MFDVLTEKYEWDPHVAQVPCSPLLRLTPTFQSFSDFLMPMLDFDPKARVTASEALRLPFLANV